MISRKSIREHQQQDDYQNFDPYSIYSEDEDVWFSEESLFENHLEEIFNKWRLLDDDIWCKLIIMERNRRIGKAYARVPIVTIDGSHELSYDGYKLALNGFDNPDRDLKTEECRKRIGKGIRIKMDNFGNILIKRLSKSGVYIKEFIQTPASLPSTAPGSGHRQSAADSTTLSTKASASGAAATTTKATGNNRVMPSRQQLIKNQNAAMLNNNNNNNSSASSTNSSLGSQSTTNSMDQQPISNGGGGGGNSMMSTTNDSAICDEVLSVGGRLDQDKIYVLFDMKKFQANITQELCRPYPDKRKLEQQCFSIVGLTRDSDDILNLPCWVMVINIVAIEVLNERFPDLMCASSGGHHHNQMSSSGYATGDGLRSLPASRQPNFVSIFDRANREQPSKEEDPYSLPANESSSDMKSSIHGDYAGMGPRSRYYGGPSKNRADMYKRGGMAAAADPQYQQQQQFDNQAPVMRRKSRSNSNIYGVGVGGKLQQQQQQRNAHLAAGSRYNNSSSIYSPGHMLVLPPNDSVPPELPPRDFVSRKVTKSKSSTAISQAANQHGDIDPERIYSTGLIGAGGADDQIISSINTKVRKTKRNRFLESLKAPLELAKSSSSRSSASLLGTSPSSLAHNQTASSKINSDKSGVAKKTTGQTTAAPNKSNSSKNIVKSFLGVRGAQSKQKQQQQQQQQDIGSDKKRSAEKSTIDGGEADSVVDSAEELVDEPLDRTGSSTSSSYNDLDIPTPDYETDENIYALNESTASYAAFSSIAVGKSSDKASKKSSTTTTTSKKNLAASQSALGSGGQQKNNKSNNTSGFRAHVPSNINGMQQPPPQVTRSTGGGGKVASLMDGPIGDGNSRLLKARSGRYASHLTANKITALAGADSGANQQPAKLSGRDTMIYGSTTVLSAASNSANAGAGAGSRYRSASMQRYSNSRSQMSQQHRIQSPLYCSDYYGVGPMEDPYGSHYGVALQARRRSNSKCLPGSNLYGVAGQALNVAAAANSYDIGRSSSGIYGNNSNSSSSSDYADWHPQMRKVNSSGYLNSIFKSHQQQQLSAESPYGTRGLNADQTNVVLVPPPQKTKQTAHGYSNNSSDSNNHAAIDGQGFAGSRTLGQTPSSRSSASVLSKQQHQQQQQQQVLPNGGPAYRSYDSSNDSYTNSSDGLDIYDHIGAQTTTTRLAANNGKLHHNSNNNHQHLHHRQFLDMQPIAHNHLTPEVHVGEWENLYDR